MSWKNWQNILSVLLRGGNSFFTASTIIYPFIFARITINAAGDDGESLAAQGRKVVDAANYQTLLR